MFNVGGIGTDMPWKTQDNRSISGRWANESAKKTPWQSIQSDQEN